MLTCNLVSISVCDCVCVRVCMLVCFLGVPGLLLWVEGAKLFIPHVHTEWTVTVYEENISTITNTFIR